MEKLKLRRHESFPLREGWIEKGIDAINSYGVQAFSKEDGSKCLGIGSNMVKSLKYWMIASNIINEKVKTEFTDFGKALLKHDPYMESNVSWWMLHYYLVSNFKQSPVLYYIFNLYNGKHIDKETIKEEICEYFKHNNFDFNEKLVGEDVNMFLRLYYNDNKSINPEDNLSSPLAKLALLEKNISGNTYSKKSSSLETLNCIIVLYALQNIYSDNFEINDVYDKEKSPCKIFNIEKGVFDQYIIQLRNMELITVNKTAGLNTVYFNKKITIEDLYAVYKEVKHAL